MTFYFLLLLLLYYYLLIYNDLYEHAVFIFDL